MVSRAEWNESYRAALSRLQRWAKSHRREIEAAYATAGSREDHIVLLLDRATAKLYKLPTAGKICIASVSKDRLRELLSERQPIDPWLDCPTTGIWVFAGRWTTICGQSAELTQFMTI